jgi:hypothetical protein
MNFNFLNFIFGGGDGAAAGPAEVPMTVTNPSTGLPMVENGIGGIDVGGSPFGMDVHSSMSDSFADCISSNPWE